jgi:hypothetical protein
MVSMKLISDADANSAGIDDLAVVRTGLVELRDGALKMPKPDFGLVALLTHAIWWLSVVQEHRES